MKKQRLIQVSTIRMVSTTRMLYLICICFVLSLTSCSYTADINDVKPSITTAKSKTISGNPITQDYDGPWSPTWGPGPNPDPSDPTNGGGNPTPTGGDNYPSESPPGGGYYNSQSYRFLQSDFPVPGKTCYVDIFVRDGQFWEVTSGAVGFAPNAGGGYQQRSFTIVGSNVAGGTSHFTIRYIIPDGSGNEPVRTVNGEYTYSTDAGRLY